MVYLRLAELGRTADARQQLDKLEAAYKKINDELENRLNELGSRPCGTASISSPARMIQRRVRSSASAAPAWNSLKKSPAPLGELPGREVWVNNENQIVRFRDGYVRGEVAEVIESIGDLRLRVKGQGNDEIVIERLPSMVGQVIEAGDTVRMHPTLGVAFEKLAGKEKTALQPEASRTCDMTKFGGLDAEIQEIREAIEHPFFYRPLFHAYGLKPQGHSVVGPARV